MKIPKSVIGVVIAGLLLVIAVVVMASNSNRQAETAQKSSSNKIASDAAPQKLDQPDKQAEKTPPAKTAQYTNEKYGVSFDYPGDWLMEELSVANSGGEMPVEFSVALNFNTTEKYATAMVFEVLAKDYGAAVSFYDGYFKQSTTAKVAKADAVRSGKQGTHFIVDNASAQSATKTERYLFAVGDKNYSLSSVNEELNQQRDGAYWDKFSKVYDSLQLK